MFGAALAAFTTGSNGVRAQEPALDDVVARASTYAVSYLQRLSGIVSEETYEQTWRRGSKIRDTRALRSDVLLTKPAGGTRSLLFRDVFEVDGRQVRDRDERLVELFLNPAASISSQVMRILDESARYNVGDIKRTVNTPTLALVFLDPRYRERFVFERSSDPVADSVRDAPVEEQERFTGRSDLSVLAYREEWTDSLIGTGAGVNLFASGRYWIEPQSGRIVMTELRLRNQTIDALIDVRYADAPAVGLFVPVAMRERYSDLRNDSVVEGSAVYGRVRRFQVTSSESVQDPAPEPDPAPVPN